MSWKKDAREVGRYALALLAGFILFPIIVLILLVIASVVSVPVALIITTNNPVLIGVGITIVFVTVGIGVWIVYKILKRVVDLVWQG